MSTNPYQSTSYGYADIAAHAGVDERTTFIRRTYLHLLGAILAFVALETAILNLFHNQLQPLVASMMGGYSWLIVLGAFMFISYLANHWAHSQTSRQLQYLGLGLYVVAEAIIFVPMLYMITRIPGCENVIWNAGLITGVVFGGLTVVVFTTRADFSFLKWGLVALSFIAFGLIIASIVMGFELGILFSGAMVLFSCGIILYNTSNVLHHYNTNQYVAASLSLFASIALLFWYVIQIVMASSD